MRRKGHFPHFSLRPADDTWKYLQISTQAPFCSSSISTFWSELLATFSRASSGHAWNQSMLQQLINEGNFRIRERNASPIGLNAMTTCKLSRHRLTKNANRARGENSAFLSSEAAWAGPATASMISPFSSGANRLGTSPVFSKLSISSRNRSSLICESVMRNTVGWPCAPASLSTF